MHKLSVIIPTFNEEKTIIEIINRINRVKLPGIEKELIIVDDGSSDGTLDLLMENEESYSRLISKKNEGKGSAVRAGLKEVTGDMIIIQDADLEYDPEEFKSIIKPIITGKAKVVFGSRFLGKRFSTRQRWGIPSHYIGNRFLSVLLSILFFRWISDMETGYKCFTKEVLGKIRLRENDFRIEPEITTQIIKKGFKIVEVPISYHYRNFTEGKKIDWRDGILAMIAIIKFRMTR